MIPILGKKELRVSKEAIAQAVNSGLNPGISNSTHFS